MHATAFSNATKCTCVENIFHTIFIIFTKMLFFKYSSRPIRVPLEHGYIIQNDQIMCFKQLQTQVQIGGTLSKEFFLETLPEMFTGHLAKMRDVALDWDPTTHNKSEVFMFTWASDMNLLQQRAHSLTQHDPMSEITPYSLYNGRYSEFAIL